MKNWLWKLAFGGAACLLLTSCGAQRSGEAGADAEPAAEYGFHTEFLDLDGVEGSVVNAAVLGDTVYFTLSPEAGGGAAPGQKLCRLTEGGAEEIPLENWKETQCVAAVSAAPGGNLQVAVVDYGETVSYELRTISPEGAAKDSADITEFFSEDPSEGITDMAADGQGNTYVAGSMGIRVFDGNGKQSFAIGDVTPLDISCGADGRAMVICRGNEGIQLREIDRQSKALGSAYSNLGDIGWHMQFVQTAGDEIMYYAGDKLYSYDPVQGAKELFSFMARDVVSGNISAVLKKENEEIVVLSTKVNFYLTEPAVEHKEAALITRVDASALPEKTVIVYGTNILDTGMQERIVSFNKNHPDCRVEVREYAGNGFDIKEASKTLNMDIITGKGPDVISLTGAGSADLYMDMGILEDLRPLMEADPEISSMEYLDNILNVYGRDGGLYGVVPSFHIRTMVGKRSVVGDGDSWTLQDAVELLEKAGPDCRLLPRDIAKVPFLVNVLLPADIDRYVDWQTGKCSFDSEDFTALLELVNTYGNEEVPADFDRMSTAGDLQSGRSMLSIAWVSTPSNYFMYEKLFGDEVNFIGYPVSGGCGSKIMPAAAFGIMASCGEAEKAAAWEFVRCFLLEDYQSNLDLTGGFPVLVPALEKVYQDAMTPEFVEDENGGRVEAPKITDYIYGMEIESFAVTRQQIDKLDGLIRNMDTMFKSDDEIMNVVAEEAQGYFSGMKSAQETAAVIQSRVQIYMDENK